MKTKRVHFLFCLIAAVYSSPAHLEAQLVYVTNNNTLTITGYSGSGTVTIPQTINGYTVVDIGGSAFSNQPITSVSIPSSVTNIGDYAFEGTPLGGITIGTNIVIIGNGAFENCTVLHSINFATAPATSLLNIGTNAFNGCLELAGAISIPNTVTNICDGAFSRIRITTLTLSTNLIAIGSNTFGLCSLITSLNIPASVQSIGPFAFYECSDVSSLIFNNSTNLTFIGDSAFTGISRITSLPLPARLCSIGSSAFAGCSGVTTFTIPIGVTNIGPYAFEDCSGLTSYVFIATNLLELGPGVFNNCTKLNTGEIPASLTTIVLPLFQGCTKLTFLTVTGDGANFSSSGGVVFNKNQTTLVEYPPGNNPSVRIYNVPYTVTSIGPSAFEDCNISGIIFPSSLTNIADNAFNGCFPLTNMSLPNNLIAIGNLAFYDTSIQTVTIPTNVASIGEGAFAYCTSLTNIGAVTANPSFSSASGVLFDKAQTSLVQYPAGLSGADYTVPDSVTNIAGYAFGGCQLNSINFPNGLVSIGEYAFTMDGGFTNVTLPASLVTLGDYAFYESYGFASVYFLGNAPSADGTPFSSSDVETVFYLPGTSGWQSAFAGVATSEWLPQILTMDGFFGVQAGQFGFNVNWAAGQTVVVEASSDLSIPVWQPIQTNTLSEDSFYFSDAQWTNYANRYYRVQLAQ